MPQDESSFNPLREGLRRDRTPDPCAFVLIGGTGDLAMRKLLPALYSLFRDQRLPPGFSLVGVSRQPLPEEEYRRRVRQACEEHARRRPVEPSSWDSFAGGIVQHRDTGDYAPLTALLRDLDIRRGTHGNRVVYLSVPPSAAPTVLERLSGAGLTSPAPHPTNPAPFSRFIFEKPFGRDLASGRDLNRTILAHLSEDQVYRIDHYLGKETVQNLLVLRFANALFEPLWNQKYIDHVQITVAESLGVEGRGRFFEEAGVLRDIVQNHLLQLLCLVAMEPPVAFEAEAVRDEKLKVLRALRPVRPERLPLEVVRGQYGPGSILGRRVPGYREEPDVAPDSATETYVALRAAIDNWRWAGVPFYLRAGKRLPKRATEIAIRFKEVPHLLFQEVAGIEANVLTIRVQPDEGILLKFGAKMPGPSLQVSPVNMEFRYGSSFGDTPPEAYERLLLDCMLGDPTLFTRADEVEAAWGWVSPILQCFAEGIPREFPNYAAGTWGPAEAENLLAREERAWRRP